MSAQVSLKKSASNSEIYLTIITGPETGTAYKLIGQAITIGRSPENNVVLQDTKASRNHARLEQRPEGYWIVDLGSQNGIIINGQTLRQGKLQDGDKIVIGTTVLQFGAPATSPMLTQKSSSTPLNRTASLPPPMGTGMDPAQGWSMEDIRISGGPAKNKNGLILVAGVLIIGGLFFFNNNQAKKKKVFELKDENKMQQEIETISKSNQERYEEIRSKGKDTPEYIEAQNFYLRGFREFREGNYVRAMQNFNSSLALYPAHPLARRYLERSQIKLREEAILALRRGEKAFDLHQYSRALSEYETVKRLLVDPNNENYKLAEQRIRAIELEKKRNR